jgi:hypothetical protein
MLIGSCAFFQKAKDNPETTATIAYKLAGETIVSSHEVIVELRSQGKVTDEQVIKYNDLLTRTKKVYFLTGDTLKLYIRTSDTIEKKILLSSFQTLASQAGVLAMEINEFITEVSK